MCIARIATIPVEQGIGAPVVPERYARKGIVVEIVARGIVTVRFGCTLELPVLRYHQWRHIDRQVQFLGHHHQIDIIEVDGEHVPAFPQLILLPDGARS